jgi:hypothetical protein
MTAASRIRALLLALAAAALLGLLYWPEAPEREWSPNPNFLPDRLKPEALAAAAAAAEARAKAPPTAPYSDTLVTRLLTPIQGWKAAQPFEGEMTSPNDLGHGVIYPGAGFFASQRFPLADTIWFRASPDTSSAIVGALALVMETPGSLLQQAVWAPEELTGNSVEISVDEIGTPFDSIDASGRWHRAILGFTSLERPWFGWTMLGDSVLTRMVWKEKLAETSIYFREADGTFHSAPDGPVVMTLRALQDSGGYDLTSEEVRGRWMRVKVERPGEMCEGNLPADRRVDHYWIRAFDEWGRPQVFFHTRGC